MVSIGYYFAECESCCATRTGFPAFNAPGRAAMPIARVAVVPPAAAAAAGDEASAAAAPAREQ